jgi:hypothetical protein
VNFINLILNTFKLEYIDMNDFLNCQFFQNLIKFLFIQEPIIMGGVHQIYNHLDSLLIRYVDQ